MVSVTRLWMWCCVSTALRRSPALSMPRPMHSCSISALLVNSFTAVSAKASGSSTAACKTETDLRRLLSDGPHCLDRAAAQDGKRYFCVLIHPEEPRRTELVSRFDIVHHML